MVNNNLVGGIPTPLKNDGVSNSWDDEIPNWMEKWKMFQTTKPDTIFRIILKFWVCVLFLVVKKSPSS